MPSFRTIRASLASVPLFALSSLPAWAGGAGGGGESLPQFDTTLFPEQIFWVVVSFVVLFVLMNFLAVPQFVRTQDNRRDVISTEIESARLANDQAKETVAVVEKDLSEARAKAQADVAEMLARVTSEADESHATQERESLRKLNSAEGEIAVVRAAALDQVRAVSDDLARAIVDRVLETSRQVRA